MLKTPNYVVITPARDEAAFIELTIKSMVGQSVKPLKWVIVSDGSTDGTDEIVERYAEQYDWIELIRMPERKERHFGGKVYAFAAGYERVADLPYLAIGNLDADTSFDSGYFAYLLDRLDEDAKLGIVGGRLVDFSSDRPRKYTTADPEYVSGPCQLFRRECYEGIGGYQPMKSGGVDLVATLSAKKAGWKVRTFPEIVCHHHRRMNGAEMSGFRERLHRGRMDYLLGTHPLWEVARSFYQMKQKPYLIGGVLILFSYFWQFLRGATRTMPQELIEFRRREQMRNLRQRFKRLVPFSDRATGTKTRIA
ncbi:MAG TPA: glycosyltransferase family 2 protein [Terracidiphilus sp.]|jgi:cellulose synthase/poly-beta-1,6-N-acetylglucosamine synthase-like glycosyltransferase